MSRAATGALWMAFAFVTWNVVFDREVEIAARAYTETQITRHARGEATGRIDLEFQPHVRQAALIASAYAGAVLIVGAAIVAWSSRESSQ